MTCTDTMAAKTMSVAKTAVPRAWRRRLRALLWRLDSVWQVRRSLRALPFYWRFRKDLRRYRRLPGANQVAAQDLWPCLFDRTDTTPFDAQYFYQDYWATKRIVATQPVRHVDVGSSVNFVGVLSASVPVVFVDIRPLRARLPDLQCVAGSLLDLPFPNESVSSLSCLHVIEHVGLGRYGDPLDPDGTREAAAELARVLAPGGNLFVSTPLGRERVCFNAHRVHSPRTILGYLAELHLVEFSCVVGDGQYCEDVDPASADLGNAACGLFWFTKR